MDLTGYFVWSDIELLVVTVLLYDSLNDWLRIYAGNNNCLLPWTD